MAIRRAQLVAEAVAVLCPHCGTPQPNPQDGSEQWTSENFKKLATATLRSPISHRRVPASLQRTCVSCDEPMYVFSDTKVQFQ